MSIQRFPVLRLLLCLMVIFFFFLVEDGDSAKFIQEEGAYIDIHMHVSNQTLPGAKRRRPGSQRTPVEFQDEDYLTCAENMIALMDRYGIEKAVVLPQPRISGQKGYYDYRKLLPAIRKYKGRLILSAGGGILNSMIHGTEPSRVTDKIRSQFKEEALSIIRDGAKGFGELAVMHVSLNPNHVFEEVSPDHPLFLLLSDIAGEHGMPIDIHMEALVTDTPAPNNLRQISTHNPSVLKANIPAFERLLRHNRKANIIWQHIGWDNVGQMTIELLSRMLEDHSNLYMGFKIEDRPLQVGSRDPMPNRMVDEDMRFKADWIRFFKKYADRLLLGSDEFIGIPGKTRRPPQSFEETWTAIKQLPADVVRKIGRENALKLYHLE